MNHAARASFGTTFVGLLSLSAATVHAAPGAGGGAKPTSSSSAVTTPTASATSAAQTPEADAFKATAGELFERGGKAMDEERWEDCRAALLAALAIRPSYQIAGNLAECEAKLGRNADAAEHLRLALRSMPANVPPERKAHGEDLLRAVRPKVAEVTLRVNQADAEVFVDGRSVGRSPLASSVFVEPGAHTFEAKLAARSVTASITAAAGGSQDVALTFSSADGAVGPRKDLVIAGSAVGGASVLAGGVLLGLAFSQREALVPTAPKNAQGGAACADVKPVTGSTPQCDELRSKAGATNLMGQAGIGLILGGAAIGAAAAAYALWPRPASQQRTSRLVPVVGPNGAALIWTGSF